MKPFAITGGYLTDKDKVFLQTLDTIADNLPDRKFAHPIMQTIIPITCHHLAHALAQIFPAYKAIDGRFGIR